MRASKVLRVASCAVLAAVALVADGTSASDAAPARVDDDRAPAAVVPFTPELVDFGSLRSQLLAAHPDTFAGLFNNGDGSLTILETRRDDVLRRRVSSGFAAAARRDGRTAAAVPRVGYRTSATTLPLAELFGLKARITADGAALRAQGVVVETIGIRDPDNALIVGVSSDEATARRVLAERYGSGHIEVLTWDLELEADRQHDSPPWNGGDMIVGEAVSSGEPQGCTTGFGVHNATDHFVTTAGHCGPHFWWNTPYAAPVRNNSTVVGATSGTVWFGVYSGYSLDTQRIVTAGSSRVIWTGTATRRTVVGSIDVAVGDPTCIEGSFSLQSCGGVFGTDFGAGNTEYVVGLSSGTTTNGDSGAPSWAAFGTGALAQGTHIGRLASNPSLRLELKINAVLFFNGVSLNTPSDP